MNTKTSRQSNIELLRIFAAIGVVYLHLNNMSFGSVRPAKDISSTAMNLFRKHLKRNSV